MLEIVKSNSETSNNNTSLIIAALAINITKLVATALAILVAATPLKLTAFTVLVIATPLKRNAYKATKSRAISNTS
jgi:hypothetical protein